MAEEQKPGLGDTDTGIKANVEALLAYLLWFVTGLIFALIEKKNKFVRFHAYQSIITFGAVFVGQWVIGFVPVLGELIGGLIILLGVVLWVVLMVKSYQGELFKLPIAGELAEKYSQ
jgi:uncharacterized membrane protein